MKTVFHSLAIAAAVAGAATLAPTGAIAAGHGGPGFGGSSHGFAGSGWRGAPRGGYARGGYYRGGWGHRGYWGPGVLWGGIGLGLGLGAVGYYNGYYAPAPYYGGYYYDAPEVIVDPGYTAVQPATGVRSGEAVPQAARAAEPIFYPRNGQSAASTETDRRDCNRWATTQNGAMADASIFQRATLACMEGRGYTAK